MQIALAQLNYHIGNFEANERKIVEAIKRAKKEKVDLIVFAELAISGYPPRDFLEFDDFLSECYHSIERIAIHCQDIAAIIGGPSVSQLTKGKKIHNSAFFICDQKIQSLHHKQLLPTYDIFDENRYFEAGEKLQLVSYKGLSIGLTICEDIWNTDHYSLYKKSPLEQVKSEDIDLLINIAASPYAKGHENERKEILKWNARQYETPILYVNHVGAQTELIFDGNSCVVNSNGETVSQLGDFKEDLSIINSHIIESLPSLQKKDDSYQEIEKALVLGIKDYFRKLNFKKATLGLSGGIDSAVTLVLAVKALGSENVVPILMPSQFSSQHSVEDSLALCDNLGCEHQLIKIEDIYSSFDKQLKPIFDGTEFGIAEENIQSRIRGTLLMAHTNKFGTILLNTSNKSELAVGYGTLYGDMSGGLSVLGDVYKTQVYELAQWMNVEEETIPNNIISKPPSAELRPDQKDTDSLPEYEILDPLIKAYIEEEHSPQKLIKRGFDEALVKRIIKMVNINEYKRHQAPPILRISNKAFGMGRRMPIVGKYLA